jgi:pimeloyl-ACP methyl ester carboxylesterase
MATENTIIYHRNKTIDGVNVAYRQAGDASRPTIVLLGGHPSGSYAYDDLTQRLGVDWHVIAPDYPGYGFSDAPADAPWTFDWLADITDGLLEQLDLERYAIYMHDFGAPVGFRIALAHPERVAAIFTQSGNAYTDGLGPAVGFLAEWWQDKPSRQADVDNFLTLAGTRMQWEAGAHDLESIDPAMWTLDQALLDRPERRAAAEALLWDYQSIVGRYPEWQAYLREHRPPLAAVWGKHDPFFLPQGAEAFKRDVPDAEVVLLDTGHFATVEELDTIAEHVDKLLRRAFSA